MFAHPEIFLSTSFMKKNIVLVFCLFLLLNCCLIKNKDIRYQRQKGFFQKEYPGWFLFPDRYEDFITGYSINGTPSVVDAERTYCVFNECIVKGILYRYQDYDATHNDYYYYFSSDSLKNIHHKLYLSDRFCTSVLKKDFIGIFSLEKNKKIESEYIEITTIPKPAWIDRGKLCWQDGNFWFGVGEYTFKGNENDAWKTAEEKAIYNIASYVAIEVHAIKINQESNNPEINEQEKLIAFRLNHKINNIKIEERWLDLENDQVYVLAKIGCDDIKIFLK